MLLLPRRLAQLFTELAWLDSFFATTLLPFVLFFHPNNNRSQFITLLFLPCFFFCCALSPFFFLPFTLLYF